MDFLEHHNLKASRCVSNIYKNVIQITLIWMVMTYDTCSFLSFFWFCSAIVGTVTLRLAHYWINIYESNEVEKNNLKLMFHLMERIDWMLFPRCSSRNRKWLKHDCRMFISNDQHECRDVGYMMNLMDRCMDKAMSHSQWVWHN